MEKKISSHWTDSHEISHLSIFRKTVENIQDSFKPHRDKGCFSWKTNTRFFIISCSVLLRENKTCNVRCNTETRSYNDCCSGKAISMTYCECVFVALDIQHAMRVVMFSFVTRPPLQHFSTLSHKRQFQKNVIEHKICISRFSTTFLWKKFSF